MTPTPCRANNGKPAAIHALNLSGRVVMIGDGWNDAEVKIAGAADAFYAFTEVARRAPVVEVADAEAASLDEVLHAEGLVGRWSFPRSRMKMLLLENIHPAAVERLEEAGYSVETQKGRAGRRRPDRRHQGRSRAGHPLKDHGVRAGCWKRPTG